MRHLTFAFVLFASISSMASVRYQSYWKLKDREVAAQPASDLELQSDSSLELYPQISPSKNPILWTVKGENENILNIDCQKEGVLKVFSNVRNGSNLQRELQSWSSKCQSEFNKNYAPKDLKVLIDHTLQTTKLKRLREVQSFALELKDGRTVIGIMGQRSGNEKHPLVIGRCGLFCNGHTGVNIEAFVPFFFEEIGANFILLESVSNKDFMARNKALAVSGVDEGAQTFDIIQNLREYFPKLAEKTQEVHVVGESLGGHGALYLSLYASLNPSEFPIKSVLALCPVVNLESQVNFLFQENTLRKNVVTFFFFRVAQTLSAIVGSLSAAASLDKPKSEEVKSLFTQSNWDFYSKNWERISATRLHPFKNVKVDSESQFNHFSNFGNWVERVRIPTLVIGNKDDMVVSFNRNSETLIGKNRLVSVLSVEGGNHCGFAEHIGYGAYSQIIKQWLLLNSSPNLLPTRMLSLENVEFSNEAAEMVRHLKPFTSYEWNVRAGSRNAQLTGFSSELAKETSDGKAGGQIVQLEIPLRFFRSIGFPEKATGSSESAALSRFLNANVFAISGDLSWAQAGGAPRAFKVQGQIYQVIR